MTPRPCRSPRVRWPQRAGCGLSAPVVGRLADTCQAARKNPVDTLDGRQKPGKPRPASLSGLSSHSTNSRHIVDLLPGAAICPTQPRRGLARAKSAGKYASRNPAWPGNRLAYMLAKTRPPGEGAGIYAVTVRSRISRSHGGKHIFNLPVGFSYFFPLHLQDSNP